MYATERWLGLHPLILVLVVLAIIAVGLYIARRR